MNLWDLGNTVSCSAYLLVIESWEPWDLDLDLKRSWDLGNSGS